MSHFAVKCLPHSMQVDLVAGIEAHCASSPFSPSGQGTSVEAHRSEFVSLLVTAGNPRVG